MKVKSILSLFVAIVMAGTLQAQGLGGLIQRTAASAGNTATQKVQANSGHSDNSSTQTKAATPAAGGKVYYVSKNGASRGADGLTPATAKKDIQAVLDIIMEGRRVGNRGLSTGVYIVKVGNYPARKIVVTR